jgi:hypothetical protein
MRATERGQAVERLTEFLVESAEAARMSERPFVHLEFDRVFPDDVYLAMLGAFLDSPDYRPMHGRQRRSARPDGTYPRVKLDLFPEYVRHLPPSRRDVWNVVGRALCAEPLKQALVRRLAPGLQKRFGETFRRVGLYPVPILTRDHPGYRIGPHVDTPWKGITVQLYLPADESHREIGTIFFERWPDGRLERHRQMPFAPNTGYAFAVGDDTWHAVDPLGPEVQTRDSILLTYYVDTGLLRPLRNRGKRLGNFLLNEIRHRARGVV